MINVRMQLDEDAANLIKAVAKVRGQTMGDIVYMLVMGAAGVSPLMDRLKIQMSSLYDVVTAPYIPESGDDTDE